MQNDPQLAIRECTLVRRQNTNNDQETKSKFMYSNCTLVVRRFQSAALVAGCMLSITS